MTYNLTVVTPSDPPVTLASAAEYARLTDYEDDLLLAEMLKSATGLVKEYLGASLLRETLRLTLDSFRDPRAQHDPFMLTPSDRSIRLPRPPITSVESVKYRSWAGEVLELPESAYRLTEGLLTAPDGQAWPATSGPAAVQITYQAGHETADTIPEAIRQGILRVTLNLYDRAEGNPLDAGTKALLAPHRVFQ